MLCLLCFLASSSRREKHRSGKSKSWTGAAIGVDGGKRHRGEEPWAGRTWCLCPELCRLSCSPTPLKCLCRTVAPEDLHPFPADWGVTGSCPGSLPMACGVARFCPKLEDILEASGNDVMLCLSCLAGLTGGAVQPCTHTEPCRLLPMPGSLRGEINSLPSGLLQLIRFFLAHSAPSIWFSYNVRLSGSGSVLK